MNKAMHLAADLYFNLSSVCPVMISDVEWMILLDSSPSQLYYGSTNDEVPYPWQCRQEYTKDSGPLYLAADEHVQNHVHPFAKRIVEVSMCDLQAETLIYLDTHQWKVRVDPVYKAINDAS